MAARSDGGGSTDGSILNVADALDVVSVCFVIVGGAFFAASILLGLLIDDPTPVSIAVQQSLQWIGYGLLGLLMLTRLLLARFG